LAEVINADAYSNRNSEKTNINPCYTDAVSTIVENVVELVEIELES